jgi:hypothetical protein
MGSINAVNRVDGWQYMIKATDCLTQRREGAKKKFN